MKSFNIFFGFVILSFVLMCNVVSASTTISTDIVTGGNITSMGTSTLADTVTNFLTVGTTTQNLNYHWYTINTIGNIVAKNQANDLGIMMTPGSQGSPAVNIQFGQPDVYGGLGDLRFTNWWGSNTYMTIRGGDGSGNVSIGRNPSNSRRLPTDQLEVYASSIDMTPASKTADYNGINVINTSISSTDNIIKSGVKISSTGNWTGTNASNVGLYVSAISGGTNNYDAIFNGGGSVGIGTVAPRSKLHVTNGTSATTTVNFGEFGDVTSKACFNTKNTDGADISFYFAGTSMVVENNSCK